LPTRLAVLLVLWTASLWAIAEPDRAPAARPVVVLTLDGAVSPGTADYVVRGIRKAAERGAGLIVLRMDTPGGLDTSMRRIVREILAALVPIAVYVAPEGARAASAGLVFATVAMALKARTRPVVSGREDMLGARGIALEDFEREGWARIMGETWRVESPVQVKRDQALRVVGMSGLTLHVEPETKGEQS